MASLNETAEPVFHLFRKLPAELQQEVWHHAMDEIGERVVEFHGGFYQSIDGVAIEVPGDKQQLWPTYKEAFLAFTDPTAAFEKERENEGGAIWTPRFTSSCAIPPFLHTTHGSRKCALRRWKLSFAHGCHPAKVYFDFDKDILIIGSRLEVARAFVSEIDTNSLQKLQHIAIKPHRRFQLDYAQFEPPTWIGLISPVSVPGYKSTRNYMKTIRDKLPSISCVRLINENLDLEEDECDVRPHSSTSVVLTPYTSRESSDAPERSINQRLCLNFLMDLEITCLKRGLRNFLKACADKNTPASIRIKLLKLARPFEITRVEYQRVARDI